MIKAIIYSDRHHVTFDRWLDERPSRLWQFLMNQIPANRGIDSTRGRDSMVRTFGARVLSAFPFFIKLTGIFVQSRVLARGPNGAL